MAKPDTGHILTEKELRDLERRIAALYKEARDSLDETVKAYFESFRKRDEAQKAKLDAGEITKEQYTQWRLNQIGRGERFKALRETMAERYTKANEVAVSYVNDETPGIYSLNRNYAAYTIEKTGADVSFTLFDEQTVKRLMMEAPELMPYYPAARALKRGIDLKYGKKQITASVTSGILQGKSIGKIANDLQARMETMNRASAIRTARTAVTGAQNAGRQDSYVAAEKMGIEMEREWLATLDNRTRHAHAVLDGQRRPINKPFQVDGQEIMFPGDPKAKPYLVYNCRCTLIAAVKGVDTPGAKRRARDPETGESSLVSNMAYSEWLQSKYPDARANTPLIKTGTLPPSIYDFTDWREYVKAKKEYNGNLSYVENSMWNRTGSYVGYTQGELEKAKRFDITIQQLNEKYPLPEKRELVIGDYDNVLSQLTDKQRERVGDDATAQVWINTERKNKTVIGFKPAQTTGTFSDDIKIRADAIKNKKQLDTVFFNSAEGTAIHEYGHALEDYITNGMIFGDKDAEEFWEWYKSLSKDEIASGLSKYATTNRGEFAAECFSDIISGNPRPIAKKYGEFLDKLMKKDYNTLSLDDTPKQIVFNPSKFPTVILPKKEYAHVMSELATHMTEEENARKVVTRAIWADDECYEYTIENLGFGNYRVIGKMRVNDIIHWKDDDE